MKWSRVLLLVLLAALTFGGSFTCSWNDDDNKKTTTAK
jgi:hypothetical protein